MPEGYKRLSNCRPCLVTIYSALEILIEMSSVFATSNCDHVEPDSDIFLTLSSSIDSFMTLVDGLGTSCGDSNVT